MEKATGWLRVAAVAGFAWGVAALSTPANALYQFIDAIPIPATASNLYPGGPFTTYDISFFDDSTGFGYIADRTNAAIDVIKAGSGNTLPSFAGQVYAPGLFAGLQPAPVPPNTTVSAESGPDGVLTVNRPGQHQLWVGDAPLPLNSPNSPLKGFDLSGFPPTLPTSPTFTVNTGGRNRVDEGSYDPAHNVLLFANNAEDTATPPGAPFGTLVDATTGNIKGKLFTGQQLPAGGLEQSVWIGGATQRFFLNVDSAGAGGIAAIDPTANNGAGAVTKFYSFADFKISSCGPTGLAVAPGNLLVINCGSGPTLVFDPNAKNGDGALVDQFAELTGGDEVWCDPTTKRCFATTGAAVSRVLGVLDFNGTTPDLLQLIPTSVGAHSVMVDPVSGEVFVPAGGGPPNSESVCPQGCILVFADVPEPGSLGLITTALTGFAGLLTWRRRRHS